MRVSKYNILVKGNDEVRIFNSISKSIISLDMSHFQSLYDDSSLFSKEELEYLEKSNFIAINDFEEESIIKRIIQEKNDVFALCIMPTKQCNFRCSYCYEEKKSKKLNEEDYSKIFDFIKNNFDNKYNKIVISWFGGEPTLNLLDVIKFNRKVKKFALKHSVSFEGIMTTNFYLLNKFNFLKLFNCGVHVYQVTIDGNKETHDQYRKLLNGNGSYDVILNNLISVKKINSNFKILVRLNFDNRTDYSSYISMMASHFKDDPRFVFVFRPISKWDNKTRDYVCNENESFFKRIELFKIAKENGLYVNDDLFSIYEGCYVYYPNYYLIDSDLTIKKCSVNLNNKDNYYGTIDNINKENKCFKFENCDNCKVFPLCKGGSCKYDIVSRAECEMNHIKEIEEIIRGI